MKQKVKVIAVDLDGTITPTDTLYECFLLFIKQYQFKFFILFFYLLKGKAFFKDFIAKNVDFDAKKIPYHEDVLSWLKKERKDGSYIILCTAANKRIANKVSDYLSIFDEVIASDNKINNQGHKKNEYLNSKFGKKNYIYAGDTNEDLKVWSNAKSAVTVNINQSLENKIKKHAEIYKKFYHKSNNFKNWIKAIRLYQWLKNLLIFLPLFASYRFFEEDLFLKTAIVFFSFSFCASAIYIFNDLVDLGSDRLNFIKSNRPFASGKLPIKYGIIVSILLLSASIILSVFVGNNLIYYLIFYIVLNTFYSLYLKKILLFDCFVLAGFYLYRVLLGSFVSDIAITFWLISFTFIIFLSLAFLKRYSEIITISNKFKKNKNSDIIPGRKYNYGDKNILLVFGVVSAYCSVIILNLYFLDNKNSIIKNFNSKQILLVVPFIFYWLNYMWFMAYRGYLVEDPILYAIKNKGSLIILSLTFLILVISFLQVSLF
jgi:4-hydroxybenzoate polyprenyltransferase